MYRISKGEYTIECDTEAELRIAAAVLDYVTPAPIEGTPEWRVGGPSDPKPESPIVLMGDGTYQHEDGSPLTEYEQELINSHRAGTLAYTGPMDDCTMGTAGAHDYREGDPI